MGKGMSGLWSGTQGSESNTLDSIQTALDIAGLIPVVGEIADGINTAIYAARGDYLNASLSAASMIPVAGWVSGGGKLANKALGGILSSKTLTNQTSVLNNYVSGVKGYSAATKDFNALNPSNIRSYSNGTIAGDLPNGNTVNIHTGTSTGGPTLEIFDRATGTSTKIRY